MQDISLTEGAGFAFFTREELESGAYPIMPSNKEAIARAYNHLVG
jgi:hypothetical protein